MEMQDQKKHTILLAEDDDDDSLLFHEVFNELPIISTLNRVRDGEELMSLLGNSAPHQLPDVLFLDINMPRKNGFECLIEIKNDEKLKNLPVIILSTSSGKDLVNKMYQAGASLYICKPNEFGHLKKVVQLVMQRNWSRVMQPPIENFILRI